MGNKIFFTNGIYDYSFDKTGVRIKNLHTGQRTRILHVRFVSVFQSLLVLRSQGKAYGCFNYEFVRKILGKQEGWQKWRWIRDLNESTMKHLEESISLYNIIIIPNGRPTKNRKSGFFLNEHIKVIINKGR